MMAAGTDAHMRKVWDRLSDTQRKCLIDVLAGGSMYVYRSDTRSVLRRRGLITEWALTDHGYDVVRWARREGLIDP